MQQFLRQSAFMAQGGIISDLNRTVVQEIQGKVRIPAPVEQTLKELYDLGRPVILNTLRFPLSIIRTFGREWYSISTKPISVVSMNGSQIGYSEVQITGVILVKAAGQRTKPMLNHGDIRLKNVLVDQGWQNHCFD